jgi:hypothetical protein
MVIAVKHPKLPALFLLFALMNHHQVGFVDNVAQEHTEIQVHIRMMLELVINH